MAKYPLEYYRYMLGLVVGFLEDKPEVAAEFIDSLPQSERDKARDLFNIH